MRRENAGLPKRHLFMPPIRMRLRGEGMKSAFVILLLSVLASMLLLGCAAQSPPQAAPSPSAATAGGAAPSAAGSPAAPSAAKTATVTINLFSFQPSSITVDAGTVVTWINQDSAPHSVTSDNGAFDTGTFSPGSGRNVTFSKSGTYTYHCSIHTAMKGTVIVR